MFLAYILLIGRLPDIKRVFAYHGAEHMTVHAQEHDLPLDVEHVRRFPTAHNRCGTAFLLVVMVVAIAVFTFIGRPSLPVSVASRIVLVPVIAAISYEIIRLSGAHAANPLVKFIVYPSLALQSLTTRQPDDAQIEVAIRAMEHAIAVDQGIELPCDSPNAEACDEAKSEETKPSVEGESSAATLTCVRRALSPPPQTGEG